MPISHTGFQVIAASCFVASGSRLTKVSQPPNWSGQIHQNVFSVTEMAFTHPAGVERLWAAKYARKRQQQQVFQRQQLYSRLLSKQVVKHPRIQKCGVLMERRRK